MGRSPAFPRSAGFLGHSQCPSETRFPIRSGTAVAQQITFGARLSPTDPALTALLAWQAAGPSSGLLRPRPSILWLSLRVPATTADK